MTRRGFGASSAPATGYSADRLGDDVLAVLDALKLDKPVLVGHSIAGQELSSIGTRHPEKIAGLIYLDAGYFYAFDDGSYDVKSVRDGIAQIYGRPPMPTGKPTPSAQIQAGGRSYKGIRSPILAIYADPHDLGQMPGKSAPQRTSLEKLDRDLVEIQSKALERGSLSARVVRLPHANHFVFMSNEADVLREMRAFLGSLN